MITFHKFPQFVFINTSRNGIILLPSAYATTHRIIFLS
ncbi:hypothetical protein EJK50_0645 [Moraxella catarrhalis]|nr:hypothetical protein EJK50_0645 [Moraxella catarrhalis]